MYIVLMAGGIGSRFWPRSRFFKPKQFLNILGDQSMLQMTYNRIKDLTSPEKILVVTNKEFTKSVKEQLPEIPGKNIIGEPFGRNTAPCIGLACSIMQKRGAENEVMVVLPSDHLIQDEDKFCDVLHSAVSFSESNEYLLTIGITPKNPETGYGYIQRNDTVLYHNGKPIYKVKTFAEKPNLETAERFIKSGDFFWNSGMFVWNLKTILEEFEKYLPDLHEGIHAMAKTIDTDQMDLIIEEIYSLIKPVSIDYGILENSKRVGVIEGDFSWNDVGSWSAVHTISEKDEHDNFINSDKNLMLDSNDNYLYSSEGKMVVAMDIEGLVMVETEDAILLCKKDQSQKVKNIVDLIRQKKWDSYL